jgi:serine protease DegS
VRYHPLAVAAFVLSLLGIPLIGILTGAVAMVLAGVALGQLADNPRFRGRGFAVAGMCLGLFDMIAWVVLLGFVVSRHEMPISRGLGLPSPPSADVLNNSPEPIRRALRANVFLRIKPAGTANSVGSDSYVGSGVILGSDESGSLILTNRHVVDPTYSKDIAATRVGKASIAVTFIDGSIEEAKVWWIAPHGVDLALVTTSDEPGKMPVPRAFAASEPRIGERVFAVGNPHELNWSYTEGVVSGIREKKHGPVRLKILQTQAPINVGNSGGGLYTPDGGLVGIVTWTQAKSQAEGIGFAISFNDFLSLYEEQRESGHDHGS